MAEIVSAAAVVISLIYVGLEIRRATLESDADIQAALLSYTHQRRNLVIESSDLASLLKKGYDDPSQLSADGALRFQNYNELLYVAWERAYMTNGAGVLSDELFDAWNGWFISITKLPEVRFERRLGGRTSFHSRISHSTRGAKS